MNKFKVGDEVYDEVNFPNQKGIVQRGTLDSKYCVAVKFDNRLTYEFYTLDGRIEENRIPTLSHTPYTIEFKGFSQERPLIDAIKICIKGDGTAEYGRKIIKYLEGLGGRNNIIYKFDGSSHNCFYYINEDFIIMGIFYIPEGYKEISLKEVEPICYVGKKIEFENRQTNLIIGQKDEYIHIYDVNNGLENIKISEIHNYKIID